MNMWRSTGVLLTGRGDAVKTSSYDRTIQPDRRAWSTAEWSVSLSDDDCPRWRLTTYNSGWTPDERSFDQLSIVLRCIVRRSGASRKVVNRVSRRLPCSCRRQHRLSASACSQTARCRNGVSMGHWPTSTFSLDFHIAIHHNCRCCGIEYWLFMENLYYDSSSWNPTILFALFLQCFDTVGWVIGPVKPVPIWPIMCLVGR